MHALERTRLLKNGKRAIKAYSSIKEEQTSASWSIMFDTTETNYGLRQVNYIYKNPMAELKEANVDEQTPSSDFK